MPLLRIVTTAVALAVLAAACSSGGDDATTAASGEPRVVGRNLRFDVEELSVSAGVPFTIVFDNRDAGIPHNLALYRSGPPAEDAVAKTEVETGPATQRLAVPALEAGRYFYQCDVHPATMTGTLMAR